MCISSKTVNSKVQHWRLGIKSKVLPAARRAVHMQIQLADILAYVRIVGQHFKQFYCRQLKNGQLDEMSAKVSEMGTKCVFTRYVN